MTITLTTQESENFFYDSLCNGLSELRCYGLELQYKETDYKKAKKNWRAANPNDTSACFEDVLMQILRDGGKLKFIDTEMGGEYTKAITMKDVHERVAMTDINHLIDQINEHSDATTADVILQTVLYGEVIFA